MGLEMGAGDNLVRQLANEMRKTAVRGILFYCEGQPWWPKLSREEQLALRSAVYDKLNGYHDFIVGVINVTDQDARNPQAVEAIAAVQAGQQRLEKLLSERLGPPDG
jgi:hypothetical protein